jgi:hypothetical protein
MIVLSWGVTWKYKGKKMSMLYDYFKKPNLTPQRRIWQSPCPHACLDANCKQLWKRMDQQIQNSLSLKPLTLD